MKKPVRSPKKLSLDKRPLQPVVEDRLVDVTGGKKYIRDHHQNRMEY